MRRLFNLIFQLVAAVVFIFLCAAAWIVFDGLRDQGEQADAALVIGHTDFSTGAQGILPQEGLDRAIKLYNDKDVNSIIVAESLSSTNDQSETMTKYLTDRGISPGAIIKVPNGNDLQEMGRAVAEILRSTPNQSVIIVAEYYDIEPTKLALVHENITQIGKAHVGKLQKEDALKIVGATAALYAYVGKVYLLPDAEKVKQEAQVGLEKAQVEAGVAKAKVDKSLNSMAK